MLHNLEIIRDYLILNRDYILDTLKDIFKQRLELLNNPDSRLFSKEIEEQFLFNCKMFIKHECGQNLGCSVEDIEMAIERINIRVYLGLDE